MAFFRMLGGIVLLLIGLVAGGCTFMAIQPPFSSLKTSFGFGFGVLAVACTYGAVRAFSASDDAPEMTEREVDDYLQRKVDRHLRELEQEQAERERGKDKREGSDGA